MKSKLVYSVAATIILCVIITFSSVKASQVDSVSVSQMSTNILTYNLDSGQTFSGSISISGGSGNDVNFWVTNPQGATLVNSGKVSGGTSFEFTAESSGAYTLHFDNSFSLLSSKTVQLTYDINTPILGGISGGGSGILLIIIGVIILIAVIVVLAVGLSRRNKPSATNQSFPPLPPLPSS